MAQQNPQYSEDERLQNFAEQYKIVGVLGQKGLNMPAPDVSAEGLRLLEKSPELQRELEELVK